MNILEARRRTLGADVYKKTVQGNPVSVRSLARMRPGLKVFGRSAQDTTTGAQLLNSTQTGQSRGVSYRFDGAKVTFEGSTNDNSGSKVYAQVSMLPDMEIGKTYYAKSFTDVITAQFEVVKSSGNDYTDAVTLDGTETRINFRAIVNGSGGQNGMEVNLTAYVAVTENNNMAQWEPYTGGKPSPSTDYPQEITPAGNDGSIQVDVTGAQLADISQATNHAGSDYIQVFDTGFEFTYDEQNKNSRLVNVPCVLKSGESYILTAERSYQRIYFYLPETKQFFSWDNNFVPSQDITKISVYVNQGDPYGTYKVENLMLNAGSTALPYEPYKQPQSLTVQTPNGLPGIPVTSGGNYTDADDQQWICDEVDFKRGKYTQRVKKVVIDSSFIIAQQPNASNRFVINVRKELGEIARVRNPVVANIARTAIPIDAPHPAQIFQYESFIYWYGADVFPDVQSFKDWLDTDGNTFYVIGQLATPIETDLTPEQMAAYANLHTNRPTTVVSATNGAGLELTYKTRKSLEVTD